MANENSIIGEVNEVKVLLSEAVQAFNMLTNHPAFICVMQFGDMLETFTASQVKPVKPVATRTRRTKEQIEADKANGGSNGKA